MKSQTSLVPTTFSGICNNFFNKGKSYPLSQESLKQVKDKSIDSYKVTRMYGEKPTSKGVLRMWIDKGITYKQRGNNCPQENRQSHLRFPKNKQHIVSTKVVSQREP